MELETWTSMVETGDMTMTPWLSCQRIQLVVGFVTDYQTCLEREKKDMADNITKSYSTAK